MYFRKLEGDKVYLSPKSVEDYVKYTKWFNDMEVTEGLSRSSQNVYTLEGEKNFLSMKTPDNVRDFAIVDNEKDVVIGSISLMDINFIDNTAVLGIVIGDKDYWGKGYGYDAITTILNYGFNILNLNNISLKVFSYNLRAIKLYEKVGFKEVGRLREAKVINGKKYDDVIMDILAKEYIN